MSSLTAAFKEWAIVVDALARGEQILVFRKGGIHEGRGGFKMEYPEFLLFPTLFHQQREAVIPAAQARYDEIAPRFPPRDVVRLEYWAKAVDLFDCDSFETVQRFNGEHVWKEEVLRERFHWGRKDSIYLIAVRVHRLSVAIELPMLPEYGGCKSWVQVARRVPTEGSTPVLEDEAFQAKLESLRLKSRPVRISGLADQPR